MRPSKLATRSVGSSADWQLVTRTLLVAAWAGAASTPRRKRGGGPSCRRDRQLTRTDRPSCGRSVHKVAASGDLVQRPVAALGGRQAPALGGDRAALHA